MAPSTPARVAIAFTFRHKVSRLHPCILLTCFRDNQTGVSGFSNPVC